MNSRRRIRFALLTFAALLALVATWIAVRTCLQQRTIRAIRASGGNVSVTALHPAWLPHGKISNFLTDLFGQRSFEVQFANVAATDADLAPLADLRELTGLSLHVTKIEGPGLAVLRKHTNFQRLCLNNNPITDKGLAQLRDLDMIERLELSRTRITDDGLQHLSGLLRLNCLTLSGTKITDAGLRHLLALQGLQQLDLYHTEITDAAVDTLSQMRGLKELTLIETQVSDAGVAELQKALPECQISHRLPANVRKDPLFESLYLREWYRALPERKAD